MQFLTVVALGVRLPEHGNRAGAVGNYSFATRTGGKASDCIACGQCEAACPQHIEIIEELKKAVEMFEG